MGLLIGASALTLCEVLDLIIYNIILKIVDQKHKFKSVTDQSAAENEKKNLTKHQEAMNPDLMMVDAHYKKMMANEMPPVEVLKDPGIQSIPYHDDMYPYSVDAAIRN